MDATISVFDSTRYIYDYATGGVRLRSEVGAPLWTFSCVMPDGRTAFDEIVVITSDGWRDPIDRFEAESIAAAIAAVDGSTDVRVFCAVVS